jgi:hypothetical protein
MWWNFCIETEQLYVMLITMCAAQCKLCVTSKRRFDTDTRTARYQYECRRNLWNGGTWDQNDSKTLNGLKYIIRDSARKRGIIMGEKTLDSFARQTSYSAGVVWRRTYIMLRQYEHQRWQTETCLHNAYGIHEAIIVPESGLAGLKVM